MHFLISQKLVQGRSYFSFECEWHYIYLFAINSYDVLKVKNVLVKSVLFNTVCNTCNPIIVIYWRTLNDINMNVTIQSDVSMYV